MASGGFRFKISGTLPVPTGIGMEGPEGGLEIARDPAEAGVEAMQREYDPLWTNALTLLDYLQSNSLIKDDIHTASLGQFTLLSGVIRILDLRLIREMWGNRKLAKHFGVGDTSKLSKEDREKNELGLEIIKIVPHTIQATIFETDEGTGKVESVSWANLAQENMIVPATDIIMKYGHIVGGRWHVLAIKDAYSDNGPKIDTDLQAALSKGWESAARERHSSVLALLAESLSPIVRQAVGRPGLFYGVTPIMIFREVNP